MFIWLSNFEIKTQSDMSAVTVKGKKLPIAIACQYTSSLCNFEDVHDGPNVYQLISKAFFVKH